MSYFAEKITVLCFAASYATAFALELWHLLRPRPVLRFVALCFGAAGLFAQVVFLIVQSLVKEKLPEASAVTVVFVPPTPMLVRFTLAPLPLAAGVIEPAIVKVGKAAIVKLTPLTVVPLMVTGCEAGVKEKPALLGVTV